MFAFKTIENEYYDTKNRLTIKAGRTHTRLFAIRTQNWTFLQWALSISLSLKTITNNNLVMNSWDTAGDISSFQILTRIHIIFNENIIIVPSLMLHTQRIRMHSTCSCIRLVLIDPLYYMQCCKKLWME